LTSIHIASLVLILKKWEILAESLFDYFIGADTPLKL